MLVASFCRICNMFVCAKQNYRYGAMIMIIKHLSKVGARWKICLENTWKLVKQCESWAFQKMLSTISIKILWEISGVRQNPVKFIVFFYCNNCCENKNKDNDNETNLNEKQRINDGILLCQQPLFFFFLPFLCESFFCLRSRWE